MTEVSRFGAEAPRTRSADDGAGYGVLVDDRRPERDGQFDLYIPEELEPGVYANVLTTWHTAHEFTLDFAALQPPRVSDEDEVVIPCRVVTRVKLPATVVFEVIRTLNQEMTGYEREFGEIRNPERRGEGQ